MENLSEFGHVAKVESMWMRDQPDDEVQTYEEFVDFHKRCFRRSFPSNEKQIIHLVALDKHISDELMQTISDFCQVWFALPCKWTRENPLDGDLKNQVDIELLFQQLQHRKGTKAFRGVFCILGVTMHDLKAEGMNFVYGAARSGLKVGVSSFHRFQTKKKGLSLKNALSVVVHEIGHLFDISHCTMYNCAMNGSMGLKDLESNSLRLCPMDLRKLSHAHALVGPINPLHRYSQLGQFYANYDMKPEHDWISRKMAHEQGEGCPSAPIQNHYDGERTTKISQEKSRTEQSCEWSSFRKLVQLDVSRERKKPTFRGTMSTTLLTRYKGATEY